MLLVFAGRYSKEQGKPRAQNLEIVGRDRGLWEVLRPQSLSFCVVPATDFDGFELAPGVLRVNFVLTTAIALRVAWFVAAWGGTERRAATATGRRGRREVWPRLSGVEGLLHVAFAGCLQWQYVAVFRSCDTAALIPLASVACVTTVPHCAPSGTAPL